jgi:predicted DNA-binding mobile mystery protein A
MSSPQLAKRMSIKAAQSVEDMQKDEVSGAIKLQTLMKIAKALDCDLVYALVPRQPLHEVLRDRATEIARRQVGRVSHTMRLEDQEVSPHAEQSELNRKIDKLLTGNPKKLWD